DVVAQQAGHPARLAPRGRMERYPWWVYGSEDVMAATRKAAESAPGTPPVSRGYSATKPQLQARLARVEGQVRGVARMVDEDRYCIDVLTQINAIRAALDKVALGLLDDHARHCLVGGHGGP